MSPNKLIGILLIAVLSLGGVNGYVDWSSKGQAMAALERHKAEYVMSFNEIKEEVVVNELDCETRAATVGATLRFLIKEADEDRKEFKETALRIEDSIVGLREDVDSKLGRINEALYRQIGERDATDATAAATAEE